MNPDAGPKSYNSMSLYDAVQISTSLSLETPITEHVAGINKAMKVLPLAECLY